MGKKGVVLFLFLITNRYVLSQSTYGVGLLPKINFNISLKNNWKINTGLESRQFIAEGQFKDGFNSNFRYERLDFTTLIIKKNIDNSSFGGGYMFRSKSGDIIHRFIQQFSMVKRYEAIKLGHRLRTDQTLEEDADFKFRIRYRASILIPTSGHSIDPNELYIKLNNEYISILEKTDTDLEIRFSGFMGFKLADHNKIEMGIDYRVNSFILDASNNKFLLSIGWYFSI